MEKVSNPSVADISQILEKEMERLGYSAFCIRATHLLSKQLSSFMEQHRMGTYDSSIGAMFQDSYCHHHIGERQLIGVKLFITRFNSIFNEKGFVPHRKLAAPAELPVILDKLLFVYRTHCSEKGNCAVLSRNTIAVRIGFLRKFLEFLRLKKSRSIFLQALNVRTTMCHIFFQMTRCIEFLKQRIPLSFRTMLKVMSSCPCSSGCCIRCGFRLCEPLAVRIGDIGNFVLLNPDRLSFR